MLIPQLLVTRFFQLTFNRGFAEAERVMSTIKEKIPKSEWGRGYTLALAGVLSVQRGRNDRYAFINRLDLSKENLARLQEEFQNKARDLINSEFDRGYLSAWSDMIRFIERSGLQNLSRPKTSQEPPLQEEEPSTS
jgi:hypothetical protein